MAEKYTLAECLDLYLMQAGVDNKKYFVRHLTITGFVWRELFVNTLNVSKNAWLPIKHDGQGNYVEVPKDNERFFYLSTEDKCDNLVPLYFNGLFNVEKKPVKKRCGCDKCDCCGLCEELSSTTMTTKVMFTQNGIDYIAKEWVEVCKNGDIISYREVPVKRWKDRVGDAGDYGEDYNNDYSIGNPFANYEIITQTFQEKICKLEVYPCGCPATTIDNENLVLTHCGNFLSPLLRLCGRRCQTFLPEVNSKHVGEVGLSDCGTKIYVRKLKKETDYLLATYQSNGKCDFTPNPVPEKALNALWAGIDFRKKWLNNSFSQYDKESARIAYERERNLLIAFDNKLSLEFMSNVSDTKILW